MLGAAKTMSTELLESLPLAHRLALSYAPRHARDATLGLLALDARLASIVRTDGEAIIAQVKLAWWRERLAENPENWPIGEPLLAKIANAGMATGGLVSLVNGWEGLLAEHLTPSSVEEFAQGRRRAWQAFGEMDETQTIAAGQAAQELGYFELQAHLSDPEEKDLAAERLNTMSWARPVLPASHRPLAVLHALGRRARNKAEPQLLHGPVAMLTAMRVGILGR